MINKAFIFDMDGVIIDSEKQWNKEQKTDPSHSLGLSIESSFNSAKKSDPTLTWKAYFDRLNFLARDIYYQAPITPNIDALIEKLTKSGYALALVSGSTAEWIGYVQKRLKQPIETVISLHDRKDLKVKPAPDGYLEAIKLLKVSPQQTIILEDSQIGINSAKATGAFVVCLTELHPKNYHPQGADLYVKTINELLTNLDSIKL